MRNYVYMLRCGDGSLYTGWTNHLKERVATHNAGKGAKFTRARLPVRLVYAECYPTREEAMAREYAIKQLTRARKERLISAAAVDQPKEQWTVGNLYYLMGKSASGKNKIYEALLKDPGLHLKELVIYTTRPIRQGEQEGVEYHFTDEAHLNRLSAAGKVIEQRAYHTACGIWHYFTVDDDSIDLSRHSYLAIGTPQAFGKVRRYYGSAQVIPIYIETEDDLRLSRALQRERKQQTPRYEELCRRFLADQKDFSEAKLARAGIKKRFANNEALEDCIREIRAYILALQGSSDFAAAKVSEQPD